MAFDSYKIKEFNADSKQCRKTSLSPTMDGAIKKLVAIRASGRTTLFAFSTQHRVLGAGCWPLSGNPTKVSSIALQTNSLSTLDSA